MLNDQTKKKNQFKTITKVNIYIYINKNKDQI